MLVTKDEIKAMICDYRETNRITRKKCKEFLSTMLLGNGSCIDLLHEKGHVQMSVNYDGGNHPEYNTNVFSNVYSVFNKDGKIYVEIEDDDEYDINNLSTDELVGICELIY